MTSPIIFFGVPLAEWLAGAILLATIVGIIALFAISKIERDTEKRHKKRNACHSILEEIDSTDEAINSGKYPLITFGKEISYRNAFINNDAYDSVIHTGMFMEFKTEVQRELSDFYITLSLRNEAIRELNRYADRFFIDGFTPEKGKRWNLERVRYEIPIMEYEKYIKENLNDVRTRMFEELPVSRWSEFVRKWKSFGR